jgi:tellurite resistance protein TehA-like permease
MLEVLTNMLARYALMSVLDIFICIFISLSASSRGAFSSTDRLTNLIVSWILVGLFSLFVLMIIVSTIWRKVEVAKASNAFDVPVNRWFKNLYDGFRANHPEKFGIVMLMFIFRLVVYAAVVVFLAENPVMQMFALIISSLMYNMTVAKLTPYYNFHDRFLHYFNESSFCTFMILSLAYTPFVTDLAVRKSVAWGQINFLHAVFFVNFVVLVTVIVNASRDLFKYSTKVKPDQPPAHGQTEDKVETRADTVKTEGDVLVIPEG